MAHGFKTGGRQVGTPNKNRTSRPFRCAGYNDSINAALINLIYHYKKQRAVRPVVFYLHPSDPIDY
jgi:hypothetical protein